MKKKDLIICSFLIVIALILIVAIIIDDKNNVENTPVSTSTSQIQINNSPNSTQTNSPSNPTNAPTVEPTIKPTPLPPLNATHVDSSNPEKYGIKTSMRYNDESISSFNRENKIYFDQGSQYTNIEGVITFRGNNYRDTSSVYGKQNISEAKFSENFIYVRDTDNMSGKNGYWSGIGWSGQALVAKWPIETRRIMGMYDWAKSQETLIEVISASQDGKIYFYELETGKSTRDPIHVGFPFKGGGALDPRGIPLLYVGGGDDLKDGSRPGAYIISLITNEIIYKFGANDSFADRGWSAFDGSAIVDAETDTLIWPGENGIIYFLELNTKYDESAGVININPNVLKWKFSCNRHGSNGKYWYGMENSVIAYQEYIYVADNAGYMICLNVNTMQVEWVQDLLDDTNCTGVLEIENGKPYIYMSTAYHYGWRASGEDPIEIPVWKISGETGEIIWRLDFMCNTTDGNSGGAQGSLAIGKGSLDNILYVPLARTPDIWDGIIVAINTETGEKIWETETDHYIWSSPAIIYDDATGKGYVIIGDSFSGLYLLDGLTGEILHSISLEGTIEATPIIYNNIMVIGTRDCKIYAIKIK